MDRAPAIADQEGVGGRFLGVLRTRGYTQTPPALLTDCDPGVTFVNATMTPFKRWLATGAPIGRICHEQECVRATGETPWLFNFTMVGALVDGVHLADVCVDVTEAILAAMPWATPDWLSAVLDARDADLRNGMARAADRTGITVYPTDGSRVGTRWRYGADFPLTGRGLTYVFRHGYPPCGTRCAPDCDCPRWQGFGNVIVVEGPRAAYVEAGVGVESMRATAYSANNYDLPEVRAEWEKLEAAGYPRAAAQQIVNLRRVTERLVAHGVEPGTRGGGYVLRRFALRLLHAVRQAGDPDGWRAEVRQVCGPGRLAEVVIAEGQRRDRSRAMRYDAATAYARRRIRSRTATLSPEDLCQTFGIDRTAAAGILRKLEQIAG